MISVDYRTITKLLPYVRDIRHEIDSMNCYRRSLPLYSFFNTLCSLMRLKLHGHIFNNPQFQQSSEKLKSDWNIMCHKSKSMKIHGNAYHPAKHLGLTIREWYDNWVRCTLTVVQSQRGTVWPRVRYPFQRLQNAFAWLHIEWKVILSLVFIDVLKRKWWVQQVSCASI